MSDDDGTIQSFIFLLVYAGWWWWTWKLESFAFASSHQVESVSLPRSNDCSFRARQYVSSLNCIPSFTLETPFNKLFFMVPTAQHGGSALLIPLASWICRQGGTPLLVEQAAKIRTPPRTALLQARLRRLTGDLSAPCLKMLAPTR